jgi:hypothetical protein
MSPVAERREAPLATSRRVNGALFLYHRPTSGQFVDASNVDENIAAFSRHSSFAVWGANVDVGFPPRLARLEFDAIVVHYSVFLPGLEYYLLGEDFFEYLVGSSAYKVAFFQDEYHYCRERFEFIDSCGIDCLYTMLEPREAQEVYGTHTRASRFVSHLPSYVGKELLVGARRFAKPDHRRSIDIGYRGRPSPSYWGRGGREKYEVGLRFAELAADAGLKLDIDVTEEGRIYRQDWHRFMADCKATLGAESGVSCFDLEDEVRREYERLAADGHEPTVEELERGALGRWDNNIYYRTITPRNFEAAAFRVCQILFEGRYSGALEPMAHYIPLRKDFSNVGEAIERFKDPALRAELTENAHRDLIASGEYSYERLIEGFDSVLIDAGLTPTRSALRDRRLARATRWPLRERLRRRYTNRMNYLYVHRRKTFFAIWYPLHLHVYALRLAGRIKRGLEGALNRG